MLNLTPISAFNDNYIWLLQNPDTHQCAAVDPGDAAPVLNWLAEHPGWQLTDILITHHHHDHTGGIGTLKKHCQPRVSGPALENIPQLDQPLEDNQHIEILGSLFTALHVPGHTKGHIAYFCDTEEQPLLFSGDTLFLAGCGRLFEGSPAQMFHSLQRLACLPDNTLVYCAHEYSLGNLQFSAAAEPDNPDIRQRLQQVESLRQNNRITLPSRLDLEKKTNPFLRCDSPALIRQLHQRELLQTTVSDPVSVFTALREWKNNF